MLSLVSELLSPSSEAEAPVALVRRRSPRCFPAGDEPADDAAEAFPASPFARASSLQALLWPAFQSATWHSLVQYRTTLHREQRSDASFWHRLHFPTLRTGLTGLAVAVAGSPSLPLTPARWLPFPPGWLRISSMSTSFPPDSPNFPPRISSIERSGSSSGCEFLRGLAGLPPLARLGRWVPFLCGLSLPAALLPCAPRLWLPPPARGAARFPPRPKPRARRKNESAMTQKAKAKPATRAGALTLKPPLPPSPFAPRCKEAEVRFDL
mmetsp:Transcript_30132/g.64374  ORF Transcript_30132/g.64374 Transcript_30132/m.64374 type:complete len:267 (-) Transcript_30132:253-1053(-)